MYLQNDITVAVAVTSGVLLPANDRRVGLVISSPAAVPVFIAFQKTAVANSGICLRPGTAALIMTPGQWG